MTPGQVRNYWRAVASLREAELQADLPVVSGPADEPPKQDSDVPSWLSDWSARAKQALDKAAHWATAPERYLRDRAARTFTHVKNGISAVRRAAGRGADKVLKPLTDMSSTLQWGVIGFDAVATLAVAYVAYRLFIRKG